MFIDTTKKTTPQEPYYWTLYIEQHEAIIGCVKDSDIPCDNCRLRLMCRIKDSFKNA